jgi:hypothetical protein
MGTLGSDQQGDNMQIKNVLDLVGATIYTAPSSTVPPVSSFLVPNAPIMSSISFAMAAWLLSAASASLRALQVSHSSSVKSRIKEAAVLF